MRGGMTGRSEPQYQQANVDRSRRHPLAVVKILGTAAARQHAVPQPPHGQAPFRFLHAAVEGIAEPIRESTRKQLPYEARINRPVGVEQALLFGNRTIGLIVRVEHEERIGAKEEADGGRVAEVAELPRPLADQRVADEQNAEQHHAEGMQVRGAAGSCLPQHHLRRLVFPYAAHDAGCAIDVDIVVVTDRDLTRVRVEEQIPRVQILISETLGVQGVESCASREQMVASTRKLGANDWFRIECSSLRCGSRSGIR